MTLNTVQQKFTEWKDTWSDSNTYMLHAFTAAAVVGAIAVFRIKLWKPKKRFTRRKVKRIYIRRRR